MKTLTIAALALMVGLLATGIETRAQGLAVTASGPKKVTISDKVGKNQFTWVSTAPLETINGTAEGITGAFTLDPKKPASLRGTLSAQVATMKSGNGMRDSHIQSDQWLNAAAFPTITFTATSVSGVVVKGNAFTASVVGNFTMHGVTKQVTVPVTLTYLDASARTRERAPGDLVMLTADFKVALKDFNVAGSKGVVGSKVGETISISAKLFGSTGL